MRKVLFLLGIGLVLFGFSVPAGATIYEEEFLFGTEGASLTGWYCGKDPYGKDPYVQIDFNLSQSANVAKYIKIPSDQVLDTKTPGEDAAGFVPGSSISWAKLAVELSSIDDKTDPVRVVAILQDSTKKIVYQNAFDLTNDHTEFEAFLPRCVVSQLQKTGGLSMLFLSPYWVEGQTFGSGGFMLHEVELSAKVPEPSTLLLLGTGLFGLLGFGRFRKV